MVTCSWCGEREASRSLPECSRCHVEFGLWESEHLRWLAHIPRYRDVFGFPIDPFLANIVFDENPFGDDEGD